MNYKGKRSTPDIECYSVNIVCSVCIANYNGENVLEDCLDSVFYQEFQHEIEVIVHDDASTDSSVELVRNKFPRARLIESKENVGFCVSNNRMVDAARGDYILLLNNDAALKKDALATLYRQACKLKTDGILGLPQFDANTRKFIDRGYVFDLFLNPIPNRDSSRTQVGMNIGACLWLSRKLWYTLGGFPEWFGSIAEDTYLCCRARLMGCPVLSLMDSGFYHWVGQSFGGGKVVGKTLLTTYRRRAFSERNKSYVIIICYPQPLAFILIPLHLFLLVLEGIALSVIKKDIFFWRKIYGPCFSDLWHNRIRLKYLRKTTQKTRTIPAMTFFSAHTHLSHKLTMLLKHGLPSVK